MTDHTADVHAALALTASTQTVTTGIAAPAVPRVMSVTGNAAGITGDVVFTGTDWAGNAASDTIALAGSATVFGSVAMIPTQIVYPKETHAGTDTVSVGVQDRLFSLTEARACVYRGATPLSDTSLYTDAAIIAGEAEIREMFETAIRRALIPTQAVERANGNATRVLTVAHRNPLRESPVRPLTVSAASIDGTALTATELAAIKAHHSGRLVRTDGGTWSSGSGYQDLAVLVTYWHGWQTVPERLRSAAKRLLIRYLVGSDVPEAAISFSDGGATYRFPRPGQAPHWTGVDEVDAVLLAYEEDRAVVV